MFTSIIYSYDSCYLLGLMLEYGRSAIENGRYEYKQQLGQV